MGSVISIGAQSFAFIRENDCFFVDKSGFIREWWENQDMVTLIARPRRFGKTLNLDMLDCFFSGKYAKRGDLFEGLSIWEDERYRTLQGSYPVISVSFADIRGTNFETAKKGIKYTLTKLYEIHRCVQSGTDMGPTELAFFRSVTPDMADDVAVHALQYLSDFMCRYYGRKVLIFMDEYDTPLKEAFVYGYWEEMAVFIRSLFNCAFKTNPCLERAVLTGITRVGRESIFSDLNNLTVVTTTSEKYCTQFGFTEEEVFHALAYFGMAEEKEKVKLWYDGFTFGHRRGIYNPWSIINFLEEKRYRSYWANSSSNALVGKLIREGTAEIKMDMETLLNQGCIETPIDEEIVFDQLNESDAAIWSLLLASGYLKVEYEPEEDGGLYGLSLTNYEVRKMFQRTIQGWFGRSSVKYNAFLKALFANDLHYMNLYMNQMAYALFSCFDVGKRPSEREPERFYHGFVLGLIADSRADYRITSNRESGFGRYDVILEPRDEKCDACVFEFKVQDTNREKTLQDTVEEALRQIDEKNYDAVLMERGIPKERIRHYGFAFSGKRVLIGGDGQGS